MGGHFWSGDRLRRAKMGVPPKKISNFFPEIFCQHIDRKSQEVSATYIKPGVIGLRKSNSLTRDPDF